MTLLIHANKIKYLTEININILAPVKDNPSKFCWEVGQSLSYEVISSATREAISRAACEASRLGTEDQLLWWGEQVSFRKFQTFMPPGSWQQVSSL